jgi:hypothetical protein
VGWHKAWPYNDVMALYGLTWDFLLVDDSYPENSHIHRHVTKLGRKTEQVGCLFLHHALHDYSKS